MPNWRVQGCDLALVQKQRRVFEPVLRLILDSKCEVDNEQVLIEKADKVGTILLLRGLHLQAKFLAFSPTGYAIFKEFRY